MPTPTLNARRAVLAGAVLAYFAFCCWHPQWMALLGIGVMGQWFIDTRAVLAVSDAHALGIDPNAKNPLDLFNQPNPYSDFWFFLRHLHLTRADAFWLGAVMSAAFLAFVLLRLRPRSWPEAAWLFAIVCAPPAIFAFNRGNIDFLIFLVLSGTAAALGSRHAAIRWLAPAGILLGTAMKFYPAAAAVILLVPNRPRREILWQAAATAAAAAAFAWADHGSILRYAGAPRPSGFFTFGAGVTAQVLNWPHLSAALLPLILLAEAVLLWWRRAPAMPAAADRGSDYLLFILGAVVLVSCYFATVNYLYRLICAIWMAPHLWTMAAGAVESRRVRWLARATALLLLAVVWFDAMACLLINTAWKPSLQQLDASTGRLLLIEQPLSAGLAILLLGFVVSFVRDSLGALWPPAANR